MDYNKLSITDYENGCYLAFSNAKEHFKVAELIAKKRKNYKMAISHLILGQEELIKSVILKIKSINPKIEIKNINQYFDDHLLRQKKIKILLNNFSEQVIDLMEKMKNNDQENIRQHLIIKNLEKEDGLTRIFSSIAFLLLYFFSSESIKDMPSTFKKINKKYNYLKNEGFYLDFSPELNSWNHQSMENRKELYNKVSYFNNWLVYHTNNIITNHIDKSNIDEFINSLKDKNNFIIPK